MSSSNDSAQRLGPEARQEVARLSEAVLAVQPLLKAVERPLQVAPANNGSGPLKPQVVELLDWVTARLGVPRLVLGSVTADELGPFERAVSAHLDLRPGIVELSLDEETLAELGSIVDEVAENSFDRFCTRTVASSGDGVPVAAYTAGDPENSAVVLVSACGMPARLCERWMRLLAPEHFVITWESRGMIADARTEELACDVEAQATDLFATIDHLGVDRAHLMGLCGGAVIAVTAAARQPERVASMSLWHGDFELGPDCPKTSHQRDLKALMQIGAESRQKAAQIHDVICHSMSKNLPPSLSHLVLYPYATVELLYLYCRLNGSIMATDVGGLLETVTQPTLVVTSDDDDTAHPAGSKQVAAELPRSTLHVAAHGDHISVFRAEANLVRLAVDFLKAG